MLVKNISYFSESSITVLGAGAFGTAMAIVLARKGYKVTLWCNEESLVDQINQRHDNSIFLPNEPLAESIRATHSLAGALSGAKVVFEAIPVPYIRLVLRKAKQFVDTEKIWVMLSKGIEELSGQLPVDILREVMGEGVQAVVVAGPNFAVELARGVHSGMVVASADHAAAEMVADILEQSNLTLELSRDPVGVQVCGATKNVIALAVGIARGLGLGENSIAALATKGLAEMAFISYQLGGRRETMYGLAGIGDLLLTAFGTKSRNLRVGKAVGEGSSLEQILATGIIAEGVPTAKTIYQLSLRFGWSVPLCRSVYEILYEGKNPLLLQEIL